MFIKVSPGERPRKLTFKGAGNSHYAARVIFQQNLSAHPLNGQIDFEDAVGWLKSCREAVNYNDPSMNMDDRLNFVGRIDKTGVRASINHYLSDLALNAFLADEAVLAYPLFALTQAKSSLASLEAAALKGQIDEVLARARDRNGALSALSVLAI